MTYFEEIAKVEKPGRKELRNFVSELTGFIEFILENRESFGFLWKDDPQLLQLARETFDNEVVESAGSLRENIQSVDESSFMSHGLIGRPLRFKLRVLFSISRQWEQVRDQFTIRGWLKRMFDAIDAILDSLISAAGGVGGIFKEFKDSLAALVRATE